MDRWHGKIAVVTGASAGIGLAVVQDLVKHGVVTVALARRPELIEDIKSELTTSESEILHPYKCDVSVESEVVETFAWIKEKFSTVHILINNAGVLTNATLLEGPSDCWRKTLDVNVLGLCLVTKEAFSLMNESGVDDGHIIHVNSVAGHKVANPALLGFPVLFNVYPASKHAVTALTESLRVELLAKKLKTKITSISPGLVKTDIFVANGVDVDGVSFSGPILEPKHISDAVIYVLSTPEIVNISELIIKPVGELC